MKPMAKILAGLLLTAAAPSAADRAALDSAIAGIYRPYTVEAVQPPVWERPLFSQEIKALITRW